VRERFGSEGQFVHVRALLPRKGPEDADENSDAWNTIGWPVNHVPDNNGIQVTTVGGGPETSGRTSTASGAL